MPQKSSKNKPGSCGCSPLEKQMSEETYDFLTAQGHTFTFSPRCNFQRLAKETDVEIDLSMTLIFPRIHRKEDEDNIGSMDDYDNVDSNSRDPLYFFQKEPVYKIFTLKFFGKTTNTRLSFSTELDSRATTRRNVILDFLARQCHGIKRLSIRGSISVPGNHTSDRFCCTEEDLGTATYRFRSKFKQWSDTDEVLWTFGTRAASTWESTLEELDLLSHGGPPFPYNPFYTMNKPQNLKVLRLRAQYEDQDTEMNGVIQLFPSLETVRVDCSCACDEGEPNFNLTAFFYRLPETNPNIKHVHLESSDNAFMVGDEIIHEEDETSSVADAPDMLRLLPQLETLTIRSAEEMEDETLGGQIIEALPATSIRELSLRGIVLNDSCFDALINYLEEPSCRLQYFDLDMDSLDLERETKLLNVSSANLLKEVRVVPQYYKDRRNVDFMLIVKKFQPFLSMESITHNQATPLWPQVLATAGKWKQGRGLARDSKWNFYQQDLRRSLLYTLLREKVHIVCSGLSSKRKSNNQHGTKSVKRPPITVQVVDTGTKRAKIDEK